MKVLDLIRYISQHPEYANIVIKDNGDATPMQAICELASIDPSHYNSIFFQINGSLEKNTLLVY